MWPRVASALLGIWLMVAPSLLHYDGRAAVSDHVLDPLTAATAIVAIWQVTRPLRWLGVIFGVWLLLAPGFFHFPSHALVNNAVVGALLVLLAFLGGKVREKFGGGRREVVK